MSKPTAKQRNRRIMMALIGGIAAAAAISHNTISPGVHLLFARTMRAC